MAYWLMKTEPEEFSWDDQVKRGGKGEPWSGVRNFTARRHLKTMKKGDLAFFYHSGGDNPGIIGIAEIVREGYPDSTATDPKDPHYDPRSKGGESHWSMVDIRAVEKLPRPVTLAEMRTRPELQHMPLLQKGNRLSVQKVGPAEWNAVVALSKEKAGEA